MSHFATRSFKFAGQDIASIDVSGLSSNHGDSVIGRALDAGRPVTVKFLYEKKSWKIIVDVDDG